MATAESTGSGVVSFSGISPGSYTLREISPPPGYLSNSRTYTVTVEAGGTVLIDGVLSFNFVIQNRQSFAFLALKTDAASGVRLAGASFALVQGGANVYTAITDASGTAAFINLAPGDYRLIETAPPAGYYPSAQEYAITVQPDGTVTVDGVAARDAMFANERIVYDVVFYKADPTRESPVAGATFALLQNGVPVAYAISSDVVGIVGEVRFTGIAPGEYTLVESAPAPWYQPNLQQYAVLVTQDGEVTIDGEPASSVEIYNYPGYQFLISKRDAATNDPLQGAQFTLFQNGVPRYTAPDVPTNNIWFRMLSPGDYTLVETMAPPGYEQNPATYAITVQPGGIVLIDGRAVERYVIITNQATPFA